MLISHNSLTKCLKHCSQYPRSIDFKVKVFDLRIGIQPWITTLGPAVEDKIDTSVGRCSSTGSWNIIMDINVTWSLQGENIEPESNPSITDDGNNTFTVVSQYSRTFNRTHNGRRLTCNVNHRAVSEPFSAVMTVTVLCTCLFIIFLLNTVYIFPNITFK